MALGTLAVFAFLWVIHEIVINVYLCSLRSDVDATIAHLEVYYS